MYDPSPSEIDNVFVADTLLLPEELIRKCGLISVFPVERGDGAYRSDLDGLLARSKFQSSFYQGCLSALCQKWGEWMPDAADQLMYLLRPHLVTVTSLFLDRYIRVLERLAQFPNKDICVMAVEPLSECSTINIDISSWHFNQYVIQRIMVGLGYPLVSLLTRDAYPEIVRNYQYRNALFSPSSGLISRIVVRYWWALRKLGHIIDSNFGKKEAEIIGLGFVYDDYYMAKSFLYKPFGPIRFLEAAVPCSRQSKSPELRGLLRDSIALIDPSPFFALIRQCVSEKAIRFHRDDLALAVWQDMMVDWFPSAYLEGLCENLSCTRKNMPLGSKVLIGSDLSNPSAILYSVVARQRSMSIFGVAHNVGTQGYIEDSSLHAQFEYSHYDSIFTPGWTRIDDHLPQCNTIPIPFPRLSSRPLSADYTSKRSLSINGKRDVLFLSNLFHRFPHISTCGQARVDFIDQVTESQEQLMSALCKCGLNVDHKPYHMRFVDLYPDHFRRLEVAGGQGYRLIDSTQKGLSIDLIKTAKIVLWDQIGSGTIDCFTSQVPTMVYWQRIYSREVPWARELVAELERCGVVHSSPETLVRELKVYLSNPKAWMSDTRRSKAVEDFCFHFGRTGPNWAKIWRENLKSLVQHPPKHLVN